MWDCDVCFHDGNACTLVWLRACVFSGCCVFGAWGAAPFVSTFPRNLPESIKKKNKTPPPPSSQRWELATDRPEFPFNPPHPFLLLSSPGPAPLIVPSFVPSFLCPFLAPLFLPLTSCRAPRSFPTSLPRQRSCCLVVFPQCLHWSNSHWVSEP